MATRLLSFDLLIAELLISVLYLSSFKNVVCMSVMFIHLFNKYSYIILKV